MKPDAALFRHESARLLAAVTRALGVEHLALAEDVVQDTLAAAFEAWSYSGVPDHYAALLTVAAKNRAIDVLRRKRTAQRFAPALSQFIETEWLHSEVDALFLPDALKDDELRMMFSCCHPRLHEDVQVALVLNVLCGFGAAEIASAFLVTTAAIEKRLSRGKKTLSGSRRIFELTSADFAPRLTAVHRALYLLFSEGYHGASAEAVVREELCREAMRLARLLVDHASSATPTTFALAALMSFDAARLPARLDGSGNLVALFDQDRSCWDSRLIADGMVLLGHAAAGDQLTPYHVEAGIAAMHASAASADETPWAEIVRHYDTLMLVSPSPVVALNRAVALGELHGAERGLEAIREIQGVDRLAQYPFYEAALGELERRSGRPADAVEHFRAALALARNEGERRFLLRRLAQCESRASA